MLSKLCKCFFSEFLFLQKPKNFKFSLCRFNLLFCIKSNLSISFQLLYILLDEVVFELFPELKATVCVSSFNDLRLFIEGYKTKQKATLKKESMQYFNKTIQLQFIYFYEILSNQFSSIVQAFIKKTFKCSSKSEKTNLFSLYFQNERKQTSSIFLLIYFQPKQKSLGINQLSTTKRN